LEKKQYSGEKTREANRMKEKIRRRKTKLPLLTSEVSGR